MQANFFFTNAMGTLTIDLTNPATLLNFGKNFEVRAYNASGGTETTIEGYSITKTYNGRFCIQLYLDGITGDGYVIVNDPQTDCCKELNVNVNL